MRRGFLLSLLVILILAVSAHRIKAETFTGMSSLKVPVGAAPSAMGGAYTAAGDSAWAVFYNPAGIVDVDGNEVAVSHLEYYQQLRSEDLAAVFKLNEDLRLAAGFRYFYALDTPRTVAAENMDGYSLDGSFIFSDLTASLSAGFRLSPRLAFGLTGKVLIETIDTASAVVTAFDAGLRLSMPEWMGLRLGAALTGLSLPYTFLTAKESIPLVFKTGISVMAVPPIGLVVAFDADIPREGDVVLHSGIETFLGGFLKLRAGYFAPFSTLVSGTVTAGAGFVKGRFFVDYGLGIPNGRTLDHRISAGLRF